MNKNILNGKNCFITGASGGIGREIASQLAAVGANVFLTDQDAAKLGSLQAEIAGYSGRSKVFFSAGDLNRISDMENIIKVARDKMGKIDILVNCAGIFPVKSLSDSTLDDLASGFNINVRSAFVFSKEFSRDMVAAKWGRIVNIGSSSAYGGFKDTSIYCLTKHALLGFSKSLQSELKEYGVRTYCVSPASVKTEMGKLAKNQDYSTFIEPKEVAEYVVFLISFDGNMISDEIRLNRMFLQ
jgi:short-subunit dehydrogenase